MNGTRLHYVVGGRGPAVMLLHGFPYSWEAWRAVMPRPAKAGYAVLAPNLRGMGDSAPAASDTFAKRPTPRRWPSRPSFRTTRGHAD